MSKHTETGAAVLRTTPLHRVHTALGASFTDFGGWQMPLRYTSDLAEHHAVRRSAGIFDLSHMGRSRSPAPRRAPPWTTRSWGPCRPWRWGAPATR